MKTRLGAGVVTLAVALAACSSSATNDAEAFCRALREASAETGAIGSVDLNSIDSIEAAVGDLVPLVGLAPDSIKAQVVIVVDVYTELLNTLATTAPGVRDEALRELQPRLDEAVAPALTLTNYAASNCRLRFEGPAEATPTPTPLNLDD